ncbi:MAG: type III pantothenate kinase [Flavobacteriales bacterium]|jgi:type III pantothenate kinase|nr:type III pantothenate kinase [Flavobacteriales bacterium]
MTQLIIDIGNTRIKMLSYSNGSFGSLKIFEDDNLFSTYIKERQLQHNTKVIVSSVRNPKNTASIVSLFSSVLVLAETTKTPITNQYKTPATLGQDRLANAVAAYHLKPNQNNLIIDIGTCLKFDFINRNNEYLGGSISLGFSMRYKSLHTFTDNLPLFENEITNQLIGNDTKSSMVSGTYKGMLSEIKQFIQDYESKYKQLNIFLTGGDLSYFKNEELSQKNSIFADPLLTLKGLKVILDYNE